MPEDSDLPPWPGLHDALRIHVRQQRETHSWNEIAKNIGISRPQLQNLVKGDVDDTDPQARTKRKIFNWLTALSTSQTEKFMQATESADMVVREESAEYGAATSAEQELLEYFLEHHEQLGTFMTLQAREAPTAEDRRKVYFWGLSALKRAHVELGEQVPPILFELERRLMEGGRE